jgi:hypothetical protein
MNPVLKRWIKANVLLANAWKSSNDVPWWYNERASLSVFAGAVFRTGGIAFEEYIEDKRRVNLRGKLCKPYIGRTDIYYKLGSSEFIGEAKQCYSGATSMSSDPAISIEKRLKAACSEVRRTKPYGQRRVGILFAIPYIKKTYKGDLTDRIVRWIDEIKKVDCSCCSWVFPVTSRMICFDDDIFPGVGLFIKEVK